MARVKRAQNRKTRTRKLFQDAKGFFGARGTTRRQANEAVMKAKAYKFVGRKQKKRQYRQMWIARIGAALGPTELNYSQFMHGLSEAGVGLDRKVLAEIAVEDPRGFEALANTAKTALA